MYSPLESFHTDQIEPDRTPKFISVLRNLIGYFINQSIYFETFKDSQFPIFLKKRQTMSDLDAEVCSIYDQMEDFLRAQARTEGSKTQSLMFRTQYKTSLKLTDADRKVFEVDESFLSAFRDIYTDKAYKYIRLSNWQFQVKFNGKKCAKIDLICESVVFFANKSTKKDIEGCHFKIPIIQSPEDINELSYEVIGYLNRLAKKNICEQSYNVAENHRSLLNFASVKPIKPNAFNFRPYHKAQPEIMDPLAVLTAQGKKVLQKLAHFISRRQIQNFIIDQQVSEQSSFQLRKLVQLAK